MRTEDGHIIRKCLNGESEAFGFLVDKYKGAIYAFAYARLRDFHDAEDVTQEVFIKAYQKLRKLRRWDNFHAWIYAITSNLCKNWVRARAKRPDSEFTEDQDPEILIRHSESSYREELVDESLRESVSEALDSLPADYRQVLTLYYLGGMSNYEIAEFLGISPSNVRMRLSRARSQLKEDMVAMMSRTLEAERLPATFTFRIAEAVKRIKIHPMPRTSGLPWGLSFATGIIIAILSIGSHPNLPDISLPSPMSPAYISEAEMAEVREMPVEILRMTQVTIPFGRQGSSYGGGFRLSDQQNAVLMARSDEGGRFPEKPSARFGKGFIGGDIAYSPDGRLLAVACGIGVWLYDASDLNEIGLLEGPGSRYGAAVAFSPDSKILAVGSGDEDGEIWLWDVQEQNPIAKLKRHGDYIWSVAFSPDGKLLASSGYDNTVRLWDVDGQKQIAELQGHTGSVSCIAFSPDGKIIASGGGGDNTVRLWDVNGQMPPVVLKGHTDIVRSLTFTPDGKTIISGGGDNNVRMWDMDSKQQTAVLAHPDRVLSIALSPDGKLLASGGMDKFIRLWDIDAQRAVATAVATLKGPATAVNHVAFSPDGKILASGEETTVRFWDITEQKQVTTLEGHTGAIYSIAFSPDGKLMASGGSDDGAILLWDMEGQKRIGALKGHPRKVFDIAFSPDGKRLASVGNYDMSVRLWDVEKQTKLASMQGHTRVIPCVAFSPDGKLVASGSSDNTVRLWDVDEQRQAAILTGHTSSVRSVVFSPDGRYLASCSFLDDGTVRLWDVHEQKEIAVLKEQRDTVGLAFSPDGKILASCGGNGVVRLWNVEEEKELATFQTSGYTPAVAFSPNGRIVASGGYWGDNLVHLWDVVDKKEVAAFKMHKATVSSLAFSPDGKWLVSGSYDGTMLFWEVNIPVKGEAVESTGKLWGPGEK